jgi:hypothetical protein
MPSHPWGTTLGFATVGNGSYTAVADIVEITPPDMVKGETKTTKLNAAAKVHTYIPGWRESGELKIKCFFERAGYGTLLNQFKNETSYDYKITFPIASGDTTPSTAMWTGFVKGIKKNPVSDNDDAISYEVTFKLSGDVTFTAGS